MELPPETRCYSSLQVTEAPVRSPGRARRSIAAAAAVAILLLSELSSVPARVAYLARLLGAPDALARGAIAADERLSPFATTGAARWRAALAADRRGGGARPSAVAAAWRFYADLARRDALPTPGSRVYLAVPTDLLYDFGGYFFFPARVEIAPAPTEALVDAAALARQAWRAPAGEAGLAAAAERGYAAAIVPAPGGLALVATRPPGERP